jgi:hypothetical protein
MTDSEQNQTRQRNRHRVCTQNQGKRNHREPKKYHRVSGMYEDANCRTQKKSGHRLKSYNDAPPFRRNAQMFQIAVETVEHRHVAEAEEKNKYQGYKFG